MKHIFMRIAALLCLVFFLSCEKEDEVFLDAEFESDVQTVAAGGEVQFSDNSTGSPATWNWTFEGGEPGTSILSGPTVKYSQPGVYSVSLELSNKNGTDVIVKEEFITVTYDEIIAEFEADPLAILENESVSFTDLSTGLIENRAWEFTSENGIYYTSSEENPVITFEEEGVYTVKLTASNPEFSSEVIKENYITVLDENMVEAQFDASPAATYAGGSVTFQDQSVGRATQWEWTFEGGTPATSTEQNPKVQYDSPGRYQVTLVASNEAESSTLVKENYVIVVPSFQLSAFFPFDGDLKDAGPHDLETVVHGDIPTTAADHKMEGKSSAVFDGSSNINILDHESFDFGTKKFTVSLWIKTDNTSKMMVWQESGAEGSKDNQAWLRMDSPSDKKLQFITEDNNGGAGLSVKDSDFQGGVADGEWHHVVVVRDGFWPKIYIDGEFITERKMPMEHDVSNDQGFKIGAQEGPIGEFKTFFEGQLDDVLIYKRALSPAEVKDLFNL